MASMKDFEKALAAAEKQLGHSLPKDYYDYVSKIEGEMCSVDSYDSVLFSLDLAVAYSSPEDYDAPKGILLIGTWGGGNYWMLDMSSGKPSYVDCHPGCFGDPDKEYGSDFGVFLEAISD